MLAVLIASLGLVGVEPYPRLDVGDSWVGESRYLYSAPDDPKETDLWVWREDWTVVSADNGVATLDCGRQLLENRMNGQLVPIGTDLKPMRWREKWSATGVERVPAIEDAAEFRTWRMRAIGPTQVTWNWAAGVKWPSAWSFGKPAKSTPPPPGRPVSAVIGDFREPNGISAGFMATRDRTSQVPIEAVFDVKGVPMPGGDGSPFNLRLEWKTLKLNVKED